MMMLMKQMQAMNKSRSCQIHLHLQVMIWTSIFKLVGKLVDPQFELAAPYDSQTEMESVLPPTYPHLSLLTGWSTAIDQFLSKAPIMGAFGLASLKMLGFMQMQAMNNSMSYQIHLHLQVIFLTIIFLLVGKLVPHHF